MKSTSIPLPAATAATDYADTAAAPLVSASHAEAPKAKGRTEPNTLSLTIKACVGLGLIFCMYFSARQGVSAWSLRQGSSESLERAIHWDPSNPENFDRLGTLTHLYADGADAAQIVQDYEAATRLSPRNALYWADLGAAYDWAGRPQDAIAALREAQRLFPNSPDINWRLGNFLVRQGKTAEALDSLRKVLIGGVVPSQQVFALATGAGIPPQKVLDQVIPPQPPVFVAYLDFLMQRGNMDGAEQVWHRMLQLNVNFSLPEAFAYFDALILHRRLHAADELTSELAKRFPAEVQVRGSDGNLITNGNFDHEIAKGGFGWRIIPTDGASVSVDAQNTANGARSLRIDFDGTQNPYYWGIFQYVQVKPSSHYRFSGHMRVSGITTESGPTFEIYDAYDAKKLFVSGRRLVGTSDWSLQELEFSTKPGTELLVVRVGRAPSSRIASKIAGTVWIDRISLQETN